MLMTVEDVVRTRLDAMYPKPVPYIGQPDRDETVTKSVRDLQRELCEQRKEAALKRKAYLAQWEFERCRKMQIAAANPDVATILAAVVCVHGVVLTELMSKNRTKRVAMARHHAVWELTQRKPNMSGVQLGIALQRDHTTILSSREVFEKDRHLYEDRIQAVARMLAVPKAA